MNNVTYCIPAGRLPDVEIYGGDTTPWLLRIVSDDGKPYAEEDFEGCEFSLSVVPYGFSTGTDDSADVVEPTVVVEGELAETTDGYAAATFTLPTDKTLALRGKYIYQITISKGDDVRVLQGKLTIRQNINP